MIDQDKAEKALNYLASTDEEFAELKREKLILEKSEKRILGIGFCNADGTAGERTAKSYKTGEYNEWLESFGQVTEKFELVKAKRERAHITIDFWRTLEASRRKGHV